MTLSLLRSSVLTSGPPGVPDLPLVSYPMEDWLFLKTDSYLGCPSTISTHGSLLSRSRSIWQDFGPSVSLVLIYFHPHTPFLFVPPTLGERVTEPRVSEPTVEVLPSWIGQNKLHWVRTILDLQTQEIQGCSFKVDGYYHNNSPRELREYLL